MKPISKYGVYPFNVKGIEVFAATDDKSNAINDTLYIINERSTKMFDLVTEDTSKVYSFQQMVSKSKDFKDLPLDASNDEIAKMIDKNQFVVKVYDLNSGNPLGYAYKFFTNKFILSNGLEVEVIDYLRQTANEQKTIPVESISINPTSLDVVLGDADKQLSVDFVPENATDKNVTWESADPSIVSVSSTGIVKFISVGETTISATTSTGNKTASIIVKVQIGEN